MKIIDYRIVVGKVLDEVEQIIKSDIKDGWQPYGNLVYVDGVWYQPTVMYDTFGNTKK